MSRTQVILTNDQREEILNVIVNLNEYELAKYYTLSDYDLKMINNHRKDSNRLGFAVSLAFLRFPCQSLNDIAIIPKNILEYIAKQLNIEIFNFNFYSKRSNTRIEHLNEIKSLYGYKSFAKDNFKYLSEILFNKTLETSNPLTLVKFAMEALRKEKIILPRITTIEKIVNKSILKTEKHIIGLINSCISESQKSFFDDLLNNKDENGKTKLAWLKESSGNPNSKSFLHIIERLNFIKKLNIAIKEDLIHPNRFKEFSRLGSKYEPFLLRRFDKDKRYAILSVFLYDFSQSLTDRLIEIHDKQINLVLSSGRKELEEFQKQNGKSLNEKIIQFINLGNALLKAKNENLDPFMVIENIMSWDKMQSSVNEAKELARPVNYDYIDLIVKKYSKLRRYTPYLLKYLKFDTSNKISLNVINSINLIKELNKTGKRKIPFDADISFIPNRWVKFIYDCDGNIDRKYYETILMIELRNRLRSGDVFVLGSKNYKNFEDYLIKNNEENIDTLSKPKKEVLDYINERINTLENKLKYFSENLMNIGGITISNSKIHLNRLEKNTTEESISLGKSLYDLVPQIKLPDLLLEVSQWTNFENNFTHAASNNSPNNEEKEILFAALMALGTNIGLSKLADSTPSITYKQLVNASEWRLYDDAMKKAQSCLVNYQRKLSLPNFWGDGSTSSSDGMRVQVSVSSHHAENNPHYGSGRGSTIYRFTSDNFSSFYTKVINTNSRDAVHVIDGLLYHESDLNIIEHYTDTAGYTDQIFALSHFLGFKFAPRIRDISDIRLYHTGNIENYKKIENLLSNKINFKLIENNYHDVIRVVESIVEGKVTASLIINKLGSYSRQNMISKALQEMGKIEKTIFILDYVMDEILRRRIQKGLNKSEAMNALARAIFFGKRGEFREREIQEQLQRASALNILINAITIWNTVYLEKAIEHLKKTVVSIDEELLSNISPLRWEHINFLGEYNFSLKNIPLKGTFRPLNI